MQLAYNRHLIDFVLQAKLRRASKTEHRCTEQLSKTDLFRIPSGGDQAPSLGDKKIKIFRRPRFLNDVFFRKNLKFAFSRQKSIMTFFLVIDQVFRIFPFFSHIFCVFTMLNVVYDPFLTRKTLFLLCLYFRAHPTTLLP